MQSRIFSHKDGFPEEMQSRIFSTQRLISGENAERSSKKDALAWGGA